MPNLPSFITKYFWGDSLSDLSWPTHQKYITETILNKGDTQAVNWLFENINKNSVKNNLSSYHLDPKSANYWRLYLS